MLSGGGDDDDAAPLKEAAADEIAALVLPRDTVVTPLSADSPLVVRGKTNNSNAQDASFLLLTVLPGPRVWVKEAVEFLITLPQGFPFENPTAVCLNPGSISANRDLLTDPETGVPRVDAAGIVHIQLLENDFGGWLEEYSVEVLIHSLRRIVILRGDGAAPSGAPPRDAFLSSVPRIVVTSGEYSEQGPRSSMEDASVSFDKKCVVCGEGQSRTISYHAVYDGHGGTDASAYVGEKLHEYVFDSLSKGISMQRALWNAAAETDRDLLKKYNDADDALCAPDTSGTTAVCVAINLASGMLHCANIGDSRAVLCRSGKAVDLSYDQKADNADEIARVAEAGGFVVGSRVMGVIAVARALGDPELKCEGRNVLSAEPEMTKTPLTQRDQFVIIACDGLWDVMSSQEAVDIARGVLDDTPGSNMREKAVAAAQSLTKVALDERQSSDNVSVVVLCFEHTASPLARLSGLSDSGVSSTEAAIRRASLAGRHRRKASVRGAAIRSPHVSPQSKESPRVKKPARPALPARTYRSRPPTPPRTYARNGGPASPASADAKANSSNTSPDLQTHRRTLVMKPNDAAQMLRSVFRKSKRGSMKGMRGSMMSRLSRTASSKSNASRHSSQSCHSSQSRISSQSSEDEENWFYRDFQGSIYGPYTQMQMRTWASSGYFPGDLEIRHASSMKKFQKLEAVFPNISKAFT